MISPWELWWFWYCNIGQWWLWSYFNEIDSSTTDENLPFCQKVLEETPAEKWAGAKIFLISPNFLPTHPLAPANCYNRSISLICFGKFCRFVRNLSGMFRLIQFCRSCPPLVQAKPIRLWLIDTPSEVYKLYTLLIALVLYPSSSNSHGVGHSADNPHYIFASINRHPLYGIYTKVCNLKVYKVYNITL